MRSPAPFFLRWGKLPLRLTLGLFPGPHGTRGPGSRKVRSVSGRLTKARFDPTLPDHRRGRGRRRSPSPGHNSLIVPGCVWTPVYFRDGTMNRGILNLGLRDGVSDKRVKILHLLLSWSRCHINTPKLVSYADFPKYVVCRSSFVGHVEIDDTEELLYFSPHLRNNLIVFLPSLRRPHPCRYIGGRESRGRDPKSRPRGRSGDRHSQSPRPTRVRSSGPVELVRISVSSGVGTTVTDTGTWTRGTSYSRPRCRGWIRCRSAPTHMSSVSSGYFVV